MSTAGNVARTGRKWKAAEAVQQAKAKLKHKALFGTVAQGRAGLGSSTPTCCNTASERERSRLVQEEVSASVY